MVTASAAVPVSNKPCKGTVSRSIGETFKGQDHIVIFTIYPQFIAPKINNLFYRHKGTLLLNMGYVMEMGFDDARIRALGWKEDLPAKEEMKMERENRNKRMNLKTMAKCILIEDL